MTRINTAVTTTHHEVSCAGFSGTFCDCEPIEVAEIRRCVICGSDITRGQFYCSRRCSNIAHPDREPPKRRRRSRRR